MIDRFRPRRSGVHLPGHTVPWRRWGPWPRRILALALLVLAGLTSVPRHRAGAAGPRTVTVPVATRALGAGHVLADHDLRTARVPAGALPRGSVLSVPALRGRRLAGPLARGEPVTVLRLVDQTLSTGLSPGTVAVGVEVDDPHVADFVRAGDRVDVVAPVTTDGAADTSVPSDPAGTTSSVTDVRVLAVLPADPATDTTTATPPQAEIVVAATRGQALRLARLRGIGPATVLLSKP